MTTIGTAISAASQMRLAGPRTLAGQPPDRAPSLASRPVRAPSPPAGLSA